MYAPGVCDETHTSNHMCDERPSKNRSKACKSTLMNKELDEEVFKVDQISLNDTIQHEKVGTHDHHGASLLPPMPLLKSA